MKDEWCYLFEKFSEGSLTGEEQHLLVELYENDNQFKDFWQHSSEQVSLVTTLKPVDDLKAFLSSALFIDSKIVTNKRPKRVLSFLVKCAAVLLFCVMPAYIMYFKSYLPEVAYTNSGISKYDFLFNRQVELNNEAAVLKFEEGTVSVRGPAKLHLNLQGEFVVHSGKIHVLSNDGKNMVIKTPHRKYIDIGTEFGISVSEKLSQVHVFEGLVDVSGKRKVAKGQALESSDTVDTDVALSRKGFVNSESIQELLVAKKLYLKEKTDLLASPLVYEYFDLTDYKGLKTEISGVKGSDIRLKVNVSTVHDGPYLGSKVPLISKNDDYLSFQIPPQIQAEYGVYVRFFYEEFKPLPIYLMADKSKNIKIGQPMSWFKSVYGKKGYMDQRFWRFRGLLLTKGEDFYGLSNLNDVNNTRPLPETYSHEYVLGQRKSAGLNFRGRISAIIIFKSSKTEDVKSLINDKN